MHYGLHIEQVWACPGGGVRLGRAFCTLKSKLNRFDVHVLKDDFCTDQA